MTEIISSPEDKENEFYRLIIGEYLKYGSVDEVFRKHDYNLPISYPGFQRLVDKWGIVKAAGPNSKLSEAITFLTLLSNNTLPLETLYRRLPPSFKTSMATLHRVLHHIKEGVTRRAATALLVSVVGENDRILIGDDISTPRLEIGKPFGSVSLPMGYSKMNEDSRLSVLRVLQQEVFTQAVINKNFPWQVLEKKIIPFMYLMIADIKVGVYHVAIDKKVITDISFSSYKLDNLRYLDISEISHTDPEKSPFRAGIIEIVSGYNNYLEGNKIIKATTQHCYLNQQLAQKPDFRYSEA